MRPALTRLIHRSGGPLRRASLSMALGLLATLVFPPAAPAYYRTTASPLEREGDSYGKGRR